METFDEVMDSLSPTQRRQILEILEPSAKAIQPRGFSAKDSFLTGFTLGLWKLRRGKDTD